MAFGSALFWTGINPPTNRAGCSSPAVGDGSGASPFHPGIPSPWQGLGWVLAWLGSRGSTALPLGALLDVAEPVNIMGNVSVENHFVGQQGRAEELAGIPAALCLGSQDILPCLALLCPGADESLVKTPLKSRCDKQESQGMVSEHSSHLRMDFSVIRVGKPLPAPAFLLSQQFLLALFFDPIYCSASVYPVPQAAPPVFIVTSEVTLAF